MAQDHNDSERAAADELAPSFRLRLFAKQILLAYLCEVLECAVTEDRLARRARGEDIPPEEYTLTPTEMRRSAQFAQKNPPPIAALDVRFVRAPRVHDRAYRPRRRERRPQSTTRTSVRRVASSRAGPRRDPDDPEPLKLCLRPGCDVKFAAKGKRRYHDDACADLARQQRRRAEIRAAGPAIAEPIVCPDCGEFVSRLLKVTGWCDECSRIHASQTRRAPADRKRIRELRKQIDDAVQRRQELWLKLPSANGNHAELPSANGTRDEDADEVLRLTRFLNGHAADIKGDWRNDEGARGELRRLKKAMRDARWSA
jgi:hypothetical protein